MDKEDRIKIRRELWDDKFLEEIAEYLEERYEHDLFFSLGAFANMCYKKGKEDALHLKSETQVNAFKEHGGLPEDAVKGLISALQDVKNGDYIELVDDTKHPTNENHSLDSSRVHHVSTNEGSSIGSDTHPDTSSNYHKLTCNKHLGYCDECQERHKNVKERKNDAI